MAYGRPQKSVDDLCRICAASYSSSKWKRPLFGPEKELWKILGGVLGRAVVHSELLSCSVCSPCQNKLLKVDRLEKELKTVKEWISRSLASSSSRFTPVNIPGSHLLPTSKRSIGESPEGKTPPKKQDLAASPLSVFQDVKANPEKK